VNSLGGSRWLLRGLQPQVATGQDHEANLLSSLSALENVAIVAELAGMKGGNARHKAEQLLRGLGLGQRLGLLPEKLSGGEKLRVSIARALVNDPTLILADEPTANLDSKIGHDIMHLLQRIAKEQDLSVVIVSHDQRIKDVADRVFWLEDGQFKEMATMSTDPECGMSVDRAKAVAREWRGQRTTFARAAARRSSWSNPPPLLATSSPSAAELDGLA
jgi:putative ABC transport system ATP-binding protein